LHRDIDSTANVLKEVHNLSSSGGSAGAEGSTRPSYLAKYLVLKETHGEVCVHMNYN
jgi:hypothetical protein